MAKGKRKENEKKKQQLRLLADTPGTFHLSFQEVIRGLKQWNGAILAIR
jgi:hypothetical protein